ncbi:glycosyltransferase [Raoultella sp. Lac2]|uniref:glycosyltransferase n=1 Tax=unclassified Raoultella TaxID=2627600 RepID=UPI0013559F7F|nr:glycosyltransferase [Raoultella sp. Lac2]MXF99528.1 glycosyltransferase [Raoultella sp. Lac1]
MKVAFLTRVDAFDKNGGDTYQIQMYKKYFEKNGHEALIVTDLSIPDSCDYYILVNMDRPLELIAYYKKLEGLDRMNKTLFLSIHHSYKAIDYFESKVRSGKLGMVFKMISSFHRREKIKNIARSLKYKNLFIPSVLQTSLDYKQKIKEIICNVRSIILIAEGEKNTIEFDYDTTVSDSFIVKNGVDLTIISELDYKKERDIDVLVCGRIESRKNTLAIAEHFKNTKYKITFVGAINNNDKEYGERFTNLIESCENMTYLGRVDPGKMPGIYLRSKIHLSASWFEVASLVDLEAYAYGCHVISSIHGHTDGYLGNRAIYLDPNKLNDITSIIDNLKAKECDLIAQHTFISSYFSWEKAYESLYSSLNKMD